jgi:hypothetical protein
VPQPQDHPPKRLAKGREWWSRQWGGQGYLFTGAGLAFLVIVLLLGLALIGR